MAKNVAITHDQKKSAPSDRQRPNAPKGSGWVVRDRKSDRLLTVTGAGALRGSNFAVREDIDLAKPITEQVLHSDTK